MYTPSEETIDKLREFEAMLLKWNNSINLVAKGEDIWNRHILDSLQLMNHVSRESKSMRFMDIGSGGGFPAIVLAIAGVENYTLVESDIRKCQFLEEAKRIFNLKCDIICERVEKLQTLPFDVVTSRAFADVKVILQSTKNITTSNTVFYLHKTDSIIKGLDSLQKKWLFHVERIPSVTSDSHFILKISGVRHDKSETA